MIFKIFISHLLHAKYVTLGLKIHEICNVYWMWWDYQNFEMDSLLKINLNNQIQAYLWKYSDASSK